MLLLGKDITEAYNKLMHSQDWGAVGHAMSLIMFGALIAFAMELSEYLVVLETSSLTLSVAGIVKVNMFSCCIYNLKYTVFKWNVIKWDFI